MPKLTKAIVDALAPRDQDVVVWDSELRRFGIRVKPSGIKSFVIQYRNDQGKSKRVTIGKLGIITADQARAEAKRQLARIELGADPSFEIGEARMALTVAQLCADYLASTEAGTLMTRRGKPKAASTLAIDRGRITHHIVPTLGKKLARDLNLKDVRALFADVKDGKTATVKASDKLRGKVIVEGGIGTAKKAVTLLSAILSYAKEQGVTTENVARGFKLPKDKRREVPDPEGLLRSLGRALALAERRGEPWQATVAVRLTAVTGMRAGEVANLRWGEVDFARSAIRLRATKTGTSVRALNKEVRGLLNWRWATAEDRSSGAFVFPASRFDGKAFGGLPGAVRRIARSADLDEADRAMLDDFSLHRLRHAFASIANAHGLTEISLAALLGHEKGSVTAGYVSNMDMHLLERANTVARAIAELMRPERPSLEFAWEDAPEPEEDAPEPENFSGRLTA